MNTGIKEFLQEFAQGGIAVHCEERKEADRFRELVHQHTDIKWATGASATDFDPWFIYGEGTCFEVDRGRLFYCELDYFINRDYTIVRFDEIPF